MSGQLKRGDVFFLPENSNVGFKVPGEENAERHAFVGKVYERKTNFDDVRYLLKSDIAAKLAGKGVDVDWGLVSRFVEYVAKNRPPERFCIKPGQFIVTFVSSSEGSNDETVHCRRYRSAARDEQDHIHFLQNKSGSSILGAYEILHTVKMAVLRSMPLPTASSLKNFEIRSVPPFQLIVRRRKSGRM